MTHYFSWRVIFLLTALISALVIVLVHARLKGEWRTPGVKVST
jgi:predicted MFS family arabinose efflux permease